MHVRVVYHSGKGATDREHDPRYTPSDGNGRWGDAFNQIMLVHIYARDLQTLCATESEGEWRDGERAHDYEQW
jgi:hypothetical protein